VSDSLEITVTAEEEIRYTQIIDGILATVDLETVTRKKIRSGLQDALGGKDLSDQKVPIFPEQHDSARNIR